MLAAAEQLDFDDLDTFARADALDDFGDVTEDVLLHTNKKVGFRPLVRLTKFQYTPAGAPRVGVAGGGPNNGSSGQTYGSSESSADLLPVPPC
jgi:hypothetical protein